MSPEPFPLSPDPIHILGFEPWAHIPCYDPDLRVAVFSLRVENRSLFLSRSQLWKAVGSKVNRKCSSFADNAVDNNIERNDKQCAFYVKTVQFYSIYAGLSGKQRSKLRGFRPVFTIHQGKVYSSTSSNVECPYFHADWALGLSNR